MNLQAKKEVNIFKKFSKLCPYQIDLRSITKKEPPEPDISCNLLDGNRLAFELVASIDNTLAKKFFDSLKLSNAFTHILENQFKKRKSFKEIYRNALIHIFFAERISANKKRSTISEILEYLLILGNNAEGEFKPYPTLNKILQKIYISRRKSLRGPLFDVNAGTSFNEPCIERIKDKFKKEYEVKSNVELLVYYEIQPEVPEDTWLPSVQKFVKNNIRSTEFQRVWIFSVTKNKMIFIYPKITNSKTL